MTSPTKYLSIILEYFFMELVEYEKYISTFNAIRYSSIVDIRELSEEEVAEKGTYAYCTWNRGRSGSAVNPNNLEEGLFSTVTLKNPGTKVAGKQRSLNNGSLKMIEHWAALSPLLRIPLNLEFETEYTPYCNDTMGRILMDVLGAPRLNKNIKYKTIDKEFAYTEGGKSIIIQPRFTTGLIIHGEFDFSGIGELGWLGKQYDTYDSLKSDPFEYACSRAPDINGIYSTVSKILGIPPNRSCILGQSDIMKPNEVAKHKAFDLMALLNMGDFFFSGEIHIEKAGHKEHVGCMQRLLRERKLVEL